MNSRKAFTLKLLLLIVTVPALFAGLSFFAWTRYREALIRPMNMDDVQREFSVNIGWSFNRTAHELERQGFIGDKRLLKIYARLNKEKTGIKAGDYLLSGAMSPLQIVQKLVAGDVINYCVTFPEGLTIREIAGRWEASGFGTATAFLETTRHYIDHEILRPLTGWEGYLFPETYCFQKGFNERKLIESMLNQLKTTLRPEWMAAAQEHGLDLHKTITLASLIEKETRVPAERPLVSAVFHNRLKKGILLQCDPTVIYALGESYTGTLLKKHLDIDMPYNTYIHAGLPPGPIGAPGKASIEAACFPADVPYLYFVADSNGGHVFSRTLQEHNEAVRRYRQWLRQQPPKLK